jgi:pyruvate kinase
VASGRSEPPAASKRDTAKTLSLRTTAISMADVLEPSTAPRKTKVVCTLGPACWSEEGLAQLLDAGCDVARFNFSHGSHEGHQEV